MAPLPRPCSTRPATSTSIDGAVPHTTRPSENIAIEAKSGRRAPLRSVHIPDATMPTTPLAKGAAKARA